MITNLDLSILDWIQRTLRCGVLDHIVPAITFLGEAGWIWILLAVVLLAQKKTRAWGIAVSAALLVDLLLCNVLLKPCVNHMQFILKYDDISSSYFANDRRICHITTGFLYLLWCELLRESMSISCSHRDGLCLHPEWVN